MLLIKLFWMFCFFLKVNFLVLGVVDMVCFSWYVLIFRFFLIGVLIVVRIFFLYVVMEFVGNLVIWLVSFFINGLILFGFSVWLMFLYCFVKLVLKLCVFRIIFMV